MQKFNSWAPQLADQAYHAHEALGSGSVKQLYKNPAAYVYEKSLPKWVRGEASTAMEFGSLIHQAILEPELFRADVVLIPEPYDKRTKAYKELQELNQDKKLVVGREAFHLQQIIASCKRSDIMQKIVNAKGKAECAGFWTDPVTNVSCKLKVDKVMEDEQWVVDIKTVEDATPRKIIRTAVDYLWPIQAAHYLNGMKVIQPEKSWETFVFVIIQRTPPYTISVFVCSEDFLNKGREMVNQAYLSCARLNDVINNPDEGVRTLELPQWFYNEVISE